MKEFAQVRISSAGGTDIVHNVRGLEHEILLSARIRDPHLHAMKSPSLSIVLERDTLIFAVSDGGSGEKLITIDMDEIQAWHKYVLANLNAMDTSVPKIHEILNSSFLNSATARMTPAMADLGRTIGEIVNYGLGIHFGGGPHTEESQRLMLKLAHGLIGFCPSVHQRYESSQKMAEDEKRGPVPTIAAAQPDIIVF